MATVVLNPPKPVPNRQFDITVTVTGAGANFFQAWWTDAPSGSAVKNELDEQASSRILVFQGESGTRQAVTLDKGGVYTLTVQEYTQGTDFGGGYEGAAASDQSLVLVGAETAISVRVMNRLVSTVTANENSVDVILYVDNDTITVTTLAIHGEGTPKVLAASATAAAKNAAQDATVATKLAALEGTSATASYGTIATIVDDFIEIWKDHMVEATVNSQNDGFNGINFSFKDPTTPKAVIESVNRLLRNYDHHVRNDEGGTTPVLSGTGSATPIFHDPSADHRNTLAIPSVSDVGTAFQAMADLHRAYEGHRLEGPNIHDAADTVNVLAALPKLLDLYQAILVVLQQSEPTAPSTENTGAVALVHAAGFREEDL